MPKFAPAIWLALSLLGVGCSAADPITNKFTCKDVCQNYADCFNKDYDVSGCADKCESSAADSDQKQSQLNQCHDCIDGKSCVSDFANCSSACGTFIVN